MSSSPRGKARGVSENPPNRFSKYSTEKDPEFDELGEPSSTEFLLDDTQTILTRNDSPDVGFEFSVNPYRGCEHGCAYCYARLTHEYLGYSAGLDFEMKILVKHLACFIAR